MDFDDCDYKVQQVAPRTRQEKIETRDRDTIEKTRLAARREHFERHEIVNDLVKPVDGTSIGIDDVDRFNRDICRDQKLEWQRKQEQTWARARRCQQEQQEYERAIERRREEEAAELAKLSEHMSSHDFNAESVNYDPITGSIPENARGQTQRETDSQRALKREARARRIQHNANSTEYDPITGEKRTFW